jgi:hypothetical protein
MAKYRATNLDLSTRIEIVAELLLPTSRRDWGRVTELTHCYGLSRTRLYQLKAQAQAALASVLSPEEPGPKPVDERIIVDEALIKRAISIFPLVKGSIRDIQTGLALLFGTQRSVGYISQTLQEAGQQAAAYNRQVVATQPVLAEADEIFQGRHPCLTVVDGHSFLLLNLTPSDTRDETSWGVTFLELGEQGFDFQDVVADGARGIAAGLAATEWEMSVQPDLFHIMQEAQPVSRRLERQAYQAIAEADKSRQVAAAAQQPRRRGRLPQAKLPLAEAEAQEATAVETLDLWLWLLHEVRLALQPITPTGHICHAAAARENISVAAALMRDLKRDDIAEFADKISNYLDALIAPLAQLEFRLVDVRADLLPDDEALITWLWQHRHELDTLWIGWLPDTLQAVANRFDWALGLFHRASSLAESIHAWIRPYLQVHRGMPRWLAPLLQLFWNHHRFQRGKRSGWTPAELAGIPDSLPLPQLFANLLAAETVVS